MNKQVYVQCYMLRANIYGEFMMKKMIVVFVIYLSTCFIPRQVFTQPRYSGVRDGDRRTHPMMQANLFHFDTHVMATDHPDTVKLACYSQIAYDLLQFVKKDSMYKALYELSIRIHDKKDELVAENIGSRTIKVDGFSETNRRDLISQDKRIFKLTPGEYTLMVELVDYQVDRPYRMTIPLEIPNYWESTLSATEIQFYHASESNENTEKEPFPVFPPVRGQTDEAFVAAFHIFSDGTANHLNVKKTVTNLARQTVFADSSIVPVQSRIQSMRMGLQMPLAYPGKYMLSVALSDGKNTKTIERPFYVRVGNDAESNEVVEEPAEPLLLVMEGKDFSRIRELPAQERDAEVKAFWKQMDPEPDTKENAVKDEFYRRVAFANQNYPPLKGNDPGWKTDRGKTYVLYGSPADVGYHSFMKKNADAVEVWTYPNIQRTFIFEYKLKDGDYRLVSDGGDRSVRR